MSRPDNNLERAALCTAAEPAPVSRHTTLQLMADTGPFVSVCEEIASLAREAGGFPEDIAALIHDGLEHMSEEVTLRSGVSAGTGEICVHIELRPDGRFSRALAALRTLKVERNG